MDCSALLAMTSVDEESTEIEFNGDASPVNVGDPEFKATGVDGNEISGEETSTSTRSSLRGLVEFEAIP